MPENKEEMKQIGNKEINTIINGNEMGEISNLTVEDIAGRKEETESKIKEKEEGPTLKERPMPKRVIKIIKTDKMLKGEKTPLRLWIVKHRPSPFVQAKLLEYLGNPSFDKIYDADELTEKHNEIAKAVKP
jgi:hypothetical protein